MNTPTPLGEHFPNCPCGQCQDVRRDAYAANTARWNRLNLHDRIRETLAAKLEGDGGRMPERGMFPCADIQALLNETEAAR